MLENISIRLLLTCIALFPLGGQAEELVKIGFINVSQIVAQSDEGQIEGKELEAMGEKRQQELSKAKDEIDALVAKYEQSVESGSADESLPNQIAKLRRDLERDLKEAQADVDLKRNMSIRKISEKLVKVIDDFARENGYAALFRIDNSDVVYVDPNLVVTEQLIEAYNKAHPAE